MVMGDRPAANEIARYMGEMGFEPVFGQDATSFYRVTDNVALFARTRAIYSKRRELGAIDMVALYPDDWLLELLEPGLGGTSLLNGKLPVFVPANRVQCP